MHQSVVHEAMGMAKADSALRLSFAYAVIPFIVHPIDNAIHALMNLTLRPSMRSFLCGAGQGCLANLEMCKECKASEASSSSNGSQH